MDSRSRQRPRDQDHLYADRLRCRDRPDHRAPASPQGKSKVGRNTSVNFPAGTGARGSSGVAGVVKSTEGALTYVDAAYSVNNKFQFALIQNRAGGFTTPGVRGVTAALSQL